MMILVFEILRETGLRTPQGIGQALSIVGALVIGQAAVDARLISAPMIIIVAISGITGIMLPKIKGTVVMLRIGLLAICAFAGLYGYMFAMLSLLLYFINMRSFGIPIMDGIMQGNVQAEKDIFIRAPWWVMITRTQIHVKGYRSKRLKW
jgi:spore germination protein KA